MRRGWESRPKLFIKVYGVEIISSISPRRSRCRSCGAVVDAEDLGFYDGLNAICRKCLDRFVKVLERLEACCCP